MIGRDLKQRISDAKEKNYDLNLDTSKKCNFQNKDLCSNKMNNQYLMLCLKHKCYFYQKYVMHSMDADLFKNPLSSKERQKREYNENKAHKAVNRRKVRKSRGKILTKSDGFK